MQQDIHSQHQEQQHQQAVQEQERRLRSNLLILEILKNYFIKNPQYRFGQGLYNLGIATHIQDHDKNVGTIYRDIFFQESVELASRLDDLGIGGTYTQRYNDDEFTSDWKASSWKTFTPINDENTSAPIENEELLEGILIHKGNTTED